MITTSAAVIRLLTGRSGRPTARRLSLWSIAPILLCTNNNNYYGCRN